MRKLVMIVVVLLIGINVWALDQQCLSVAKYKSFMYVCFYQNGVDLDPMSVTDACNKRFQEVFPNDVKNLPTNDLDTYAIDTYSEYLADEAGDINLNDEEVIDKVLAFLYSRCMANK